MISIVKDFHNYHVTSNGDVFSFFGNKFRKLKLQKTCHGYLRARVSKNSKPMHLSVHRLVASAFLSNRKNKPCVNHINGNKLDNRLINLEWVTNSENNLHSYRTLKNKAARGVKHGMSKLNEKEVLEIKKLLKKDILQKDIAKKFNVSKGAITDINRGKNWKHLN